MADWYMTWESTWQMDEILSTISTLLQAGVTNKEQLADENFNLKHSCVCSLTEI